MTGITRAARLGSKAQGDYVLIKGAYLLGCRISEIAVIRWKDIKALKGGSQIHLKGKRSNRRTVGVSPATISFFQGLDRCSNEEFVFHSPMG